MPVRVRCVRWHSSMRSGCKNLRTAHAFERQAHNVAAASMQLASAGEGWLVNTARNKQHDSGMQSKTRVVTRPLAEDALASHFPAPGQIVHDVELF